MEIKRKNQSSIVFDMVVLLLLILLLSKIQLTKNRSYTASSSNITRLKKKNPCHVIHTNNNKKNKSLTLTCTHTLYTHTNYLILFVCPYFLYVQTHTHTFFSQCVIIKFDPIEK